MSKLGRKKSGKVESVDLDGFITIRDLLIEENNNLLGKVLTIIDCSIPNPGQNKAVKDVIKNAFYQKDLDRVAANMACSVGFDYHEALSHISLLQSSPIEL